MQVRPITELCFSHSSSSGSPIETAPVATLGADVLSARPALVIANPSYGHAVPTGLAPSTSLFTSSSSSASTTASGYRSAFREVVPESSTTKPAQRRTSSPLFVQFSRANGDDSGTATMRTTSSESSSGGDCSVGRPR